MIITSRDLSSVSLALLCRVPGQW